MLSHANRFGRRLTGLVVFLGFSVIACIAFALIAAHEASGTVRQLAGVETEAAALAREFRSAVNSLQSALLRVGDRPSADSLAVIQQRRDRLTGWLNERVRAARSNAEREVLRRLKDETRAYVASLDTLGAPSQGYSIPLSRAIIAKLDERAIRLQAGADEFAAVHEASLRGLLVASLDSVRRLRNLVFGCLALLLAATLVVGMLVYRDLVRPLRVQLVENTVLLAQQEKLASLGTLAAGVAHEIRNPLTAIKARLYTLRREVSAEGIEDVGAIAAEISRLEEIVRVVLGYARPADPALREVDLADWLTQLFHFLEADLKANQIELTMEAAKDLRVRADIDQLRQIVLNLVGNAREAFEGRPGKIRLIASRERSKLRGRHTDVAVVSVTDDGPGISPEIKERLFDPFFTTKAHGTGLGLSIVARLAERNGGEIVFQTAPHAGTRFDVRLPLHKPVVSI